MHKLHMYTSAHSLMGFLQRKSDSTLSHKSPSFHLANKKRDRKSAKGILLHRRIGTKSHFHSSCSKPQLSEESAHVLHLLSCSNVVVVHIWSLTKSCVARRERNIATGTTITP